MWGKVVRTLLLYVSKDEDMKLCRNYTPDSADSASDCRHDAPAKRRKVVLIHVFPHLAKSSFIPVSPKMCTPLQLNCTLTYDRREHPLSTKDQQSLHKEATMTLSSGIFGVNSSMGPFLLRFGSSSSCCCTFLRVTAADHLPSSYPIP